MGSGAWSAKDWVSYSASTVTKRSVGEIYSASCMKAENNPNGIVRESRDSEDHPHSTPIIIGLDVTGSMGRILHAVAEKLGDMVGEILERKPVEDPQILFAAIGDATCDAAPLQVTQFESDIRIAKQLMELWFERGGGGNKFESYPLAWWFAANHTATDQNQKRGKKGFLFTMGDDGFPAKLTGRELRTVFGDEVREDVSIEDVLSQANRRYEVFHLCLRQGGTYRDDDLDAWQRLLGERAIPVSDYKKIPEIIVSILERMAGKSLDEVVNSWDGSTAVAVQEAIQGLSEKPDEKNDVVAF